MLYKFTNLNKYGNLRIRIIYHPEGKPLIIKPTKIKNIIPINIDFTFFLSLLLLLLIYEQSYLG